MNTQVTIQFHNEELDTDIVIGDKSINIPAELMPSVGDIVAFETEQPRGNIVESTGMFGHFKVVNVIKQYTENSVSIDVEVKKYRNLQRK